MLKTETTSSRTAPMIQFDYRVITVRVYDNRKDSPPKMTRLKYDSGCKVSVWGIELPGIPRRGGAA